jgi:ubiquinone/menaquinone biosynthesis C-methylase UbiE
MMRRFVFLAVLGVLALGPAVAPVLGQSEREDRHRVPADYMSFRGAQWLERAERVSEEHPEQVLDAMRLAPGDVAADVGCGSGYYARRIARRVQPGGTVYCEDIQPEMLEMMQQLASEEDVTGIRPILGTFTDPKLPAGEIDWVIIADVYHEMSDPEPMLAGIRRALSPDGMVALLEYRVEDGTGDQIKADHVMSVRQVLLEWKAAGFELVTLHEFLPGQHLFFFRAAGSNAGGGVLADHDLFDAIDAGLVEVQASGDGEMSVSVWIRRTGDTPFIVTSPVATFFVSAVGRRDMVARRDGWIRLDDAEWQEWSFRAIGRQRDRAAPGSGDTLAIQSPETDTRLADLMYQIQIGTYTVADSPTLYPPRTHTVEQAAMWIVTDDPAFDDLVPELEDPRIPPRYAVAFALVFLDEAGIELTDRRVWTDRERVFGVLRDQGLGVWYESKTAP